MERLHRHIGRPNAWARILRKIHFEPLTLHTIGSAEELQADLARIREFGYVLSDQELTVGLRSVAAPVFKNGRVEGAFGISYAVNRAKEEGLETALVRQVLETAAKVSF
jgi:DNA-binding IclR family transcriptional regulator